METQRIDVLTRFVATATSRRSIVTAVLGSAAGALLSQLGPDRLAVSQTRRCSGRCDPTTGTCACAADGDCCDEYACCFGTCTRTSDDHDNCGSCGYECPSDECHDAVCSDTVCGQVNKPDKTACTAGGCVENGACRDGVCQGQPVADDTPCDDGLPCTLNGFCRNGACLSTKAPDGTACGPRGETCQGGLCCAAGHVCERGSCIRSRVETCGTGSACDPAVATCIDDRCCPHEGVCNGICCDYGTARGYSLFCHDGGCCRVHLICGETCCGGGVDPTADNDVICSCGTCRLTGQPCIDGGCPSCPEDGEWGEICVVRDDGSGICCPAYRACGTVCCGPAQHCENGICVGCSSGWPRRFRIS